MNKIKVGNVILGDEMPNLCFIDGENERGN